MSSKPLTVLVLYHLRGSLPLRPSIEANLRCWGRYSIHNVIYWNASFGNTNLCVNLLDPDIIILHTSFCGLRWQTASLTRLSSDIDTISRHRSLKIALPQDEFYLTDLLESLLLRLNTSILLTCANPISWNILYPRLSKTLKLKTILTGYLDPKFIRRAKRYYKPVEKRRIPVSYRAWHAEYWLGEHGQKKVQVGQNFIKALDSLNIKSDISMNSDDVLTGDDWIRFLANSRATIGVEGGASLIDRDGTLRQASIHFIEQCPNGSFEDFYKSYLNNFHYALELKCLSPRHLEAIATKTLQFLVEGEYNGILKKGRHYINILPDFSNINTALSILDNPVEMNRITETAYQEIIEHGTVSYPFFVSQIEREFFNLAARRRARPFDWFNRFLVRFADWLQWRVIQAESVYIKYPAFFKILSPFKTLYQRIRNVW